VRRDVAPFANRSRAAAKHWSIDLGDFGGVDVIEVLVAVGDAVREQGLVARNRRRQWTFRHRNSIVTNCGSRSATGQYR
jgi:hypothetical protein